jgi:hypothetical protein
MCLILSRQKEASGLYVLLLYPLFGTSYRVEGPSGLQSASQTTSNLAVMGLFKGEGQSTCAKSAKKTPLWRHLRWEVARSKGVKG